MFLKLDVETIVDLGRSEERQSPAGHRLCALAFAHPGYMLVCWRIQLDPTHLKTTVPSFLGATPGSTKHAVG